MRSIVWSGDWLITQQYGYTDLAVEPLYKGRHFHCGIDIGTPIGTPMFAARAGTVTHRTFGILGVLTAGGQTDYYVHGDYSALLGERVGAGTRLGTTGARVPGGGSLTGPHLHFEVQAGSLINVPPAIDPNPILFPTSGGGITQGAIDMTPRQNELLEAVAGSVVGVQEDQGKAVLNRLTALEADLKAHAATAAASDLSALSVKLDQIAAQLKALTMRVI